MNNYFLQVFLKTLPNNCKIIELSDGELNILLSSGKMKKLFWNSKELTFEELT